METTLKKKITAEFFLACHRAIHDKSRSHNVLSFKVFIKDEEIVVLKPGTLRCIHVPDGHGKNHLIIEQNPHKASPYSKKARAGHRITWFIPSNDKRAWGLIEDEQIINMPNL